MIQLLMLFAFTPIANDGLLAKGPIQPCVWPNPCSLTETVEVAAKYEICLWPKKCSGKADAPAVAKGPIQICLWPNPCGKTETPAVLAKGPIEICVWPNPCSVHQEDIV